MASTYTTIQGDTWDMIAYRLWGRELLCDRLMRANPEWLEVVVFGPGVVLTVPEIQNARPREPAAPWQK